MYLYLIAETTTTTVASVDTSSDSSSVSTGEQILTNIFGSGTVTDVLMASGVGTLLGAFMDFLFPNRRR